MYVLLMYSTHKPSDNHLKRIAAISPDIEVGVAMDEEDAIQKAAKANIIFGHRYLSQCLDFAKQLSWVQSTAGGVDRLPLAKLAQKSVTLTNMTVQSETIARHAITLAWAINRGLHHFEQNQRRGIWDQSHTWLPQPRKAIILGLGSIGLNIAKKLTLEGISVVGVKANSPLKDIPNVDRIYTYNSPWLEELQSTDWMFLCLPINDSSKNLIDKDVLSRLPCHSTVINVGRGEVIITKDLCDLLVEGKLGGAALDVIYPKPQSQNEDLWNIPNLLITPHIAAHSRERNDNLERFSEQQLFKYLNNQVLENIVTY